MEYYFRAFKIKALNIKIILSIYPTASMGGAPLLVFNSFSHSHP